MTEGPTRSSLPADWWQRVGHDLRGPVAPMRMAVQVLRTAQLTTDEKAQALDLLDRQIDVLISAIAEVGDLLRADAGAFVLNLEHSDLNLLFDSLQGRRSLARALSARGQALELQPAELPLLALHDPSRITALLEYLLVRLASNAPEGATLNVKVAPGNDGLPTFSMHASAPNGGKWSERADAELAYVAGVQPPAREVSAHELESRSILMHEIVRISLISFTSIDYETGLSFRMPVRE